MNGLLIRPYRDGDAPALAQIFHRAVRDGAQDHYSERERAAWSPSIPEGSEWVARLTVADTIVAECDGTPAGFMTINTGTGFLDFAYVAPEQMGRGVAEVLYAVIEGRARVAGCRVLETEASKLAERFFMRRGWHLVARQSVDRGGVAIPNAVMRKPLTLREAVA